jgi:hypothetical protein
MTKAITLIAAIAGFFLTPATFAAYTPYEEDTKVSYKFEKGHVIDFLLLTQKPDSSDALNDYARAAIAEARSLGYKGNGGFNITRNPIQSNIHPQSLIFGSWPGNFFDREKALAELLENVPTLYSKRLDVWSSFYMTNYEIKEDISFDVYHDKIQVLSSFWKKDAKQFADFKADYFQNVSRYGGSIKLNFSDAKSPFGYDYTPDFTTLIEWDSQEGFDAFLSATETFDKKALKQAHLFYLTPPKPRR